MAQRTPRSDGQETAPVRGLRSMGSSSDVLSLSARSTRASLPHASPPPAYVAESAAESLLYAEIEVPVKVSSSALALVNGFLDQILYDILAKSHSTSLGALRAAIPVVLKQRLGQSAIRAADEELQDYLDEQELAELQLSSGVLDPKMEFDVELAWMLTRLRCMVYAKLGDLEEEDEEDLLEDDELRYHVTRVKESLRASAAITPASAIFLTTILEFLAEQALCIAAQHSRKRHNSIKGQATHQSANSAIFLDDIDMSGIGKEGPLIRLWRSWKGSVRTTGSISSRPTTPNIMTPVSPDSPTFEWKSPTAPPFSTIQEEHSPSIQPTSFPLPADIPLPMSDNDVTEIEVPGVARDPDNPEDGELTARPTFEKRRPSSMLVMPGNFPGPPTPTTANQDGDRPSWGRTRSHSLPTPAQSPSLLQFDKSVDEIASSNIAVPPNDTEISAPSVPDQTTERSGEVEREADAVPERVATPSRSNIDSATVATIAGALNVEASRALRRDRSSQNDLISRAPGAEANTQASITTIDDFQQLHMPARSQTADTLNSLPGAAEPTNPAGNTQNTVADEENIQAEDRANPRDSGFGVDVPDNVQAGHHGDFAPPPMLAEDQSLPAATDPVSSLPSNTDMESRPVGRVPYQGHVANYRNLDTGNDSHGVAIIQGTGRSTRHPTTDQNTSRSATTSAWPAVVPDRRSSLERQADRQSPTETRFPQHIPTSQRTEGVEKEAVPHYATSAFANTSTSHSRTSSAKESRPGTSGSATAKRQHLRLRSNTDDGNKRITPPDEADRAKRSLDVLIDSDETLHYTLTPESARADNEPPRPKPKTQAQELAEFFRTTAPPGEEAARPRSSRSNKDNMNGLRANPPGSPQPPVPVIPSQSGVQQSLNSPSKARNPLGEPRDARMARGTTRDLADYARSTGPENDRQLPKFLNARPGTLQTGYDGHSFENNEGMSNETVTRPSTTSSKTTNRLKYQARDARAPRTAESSDLIDFIREGPPRAVGEHRIDRNVAPFRTTMDSDDLNALAPPPDIDTNGRYSDASAQESAMTVKSMPSSMNSRTGLLDSSNRGASKLSNGYGGGSAAVSRQPVIPESDGMPPRTRRRVRDPYAIDFSDDEELEEELPRPQRRGDEESLVDFLRNTAPPPGSTTLPILGLNPNPTQPDPSSMLKRTGSSSKLRDYLQGATGGKTGPNPVKNTNGARADSPHLTQIGSKMDKYRPTQPTHAAHVDRNRQKMRAEPREPMASSGGGTADLAAYLKNSGPPPGSEAPPQPFITSANGGKDQAGFMKFFSRRGSVRK